MDDRAYTFQRFLASKRSVDDRALNRGVLDALRAALPPRPERLRILELGAGLGSMVERLCELGIISRASYTLLDRDALSLAAGHSALAAWAQTRGQTDVAPGQVRLHSTALDLELRFVQGEIGEFLTTAAEAAGYDIVIAHAVLDLLDVPTLLPLLWRALAPAGHAWFTINFDGETILLPSLALDDEVIGLYHLSMNNRTGDSRTGRHLLEQVPASGATIVSAGSSDWVVWPTHGAYPGDEAHFLHHIVHTIDCELRDHAQLDRERFRQWVASRHSQVDAGSLCYIAHQLDVLARRP